MEIIRYLTITEIDYQSTQPHIAFLSPYYSLPIGKTHRIDKVPTQPVQKDKTCHNMGYQLSNEFKESPIIIKSNIYYWMQKHRCHGLTQPRQQGSQLCLLQLWENKKPAFSWQDGWISSTAYLRVGFLCCSCCLFFFFQDAWQWNNEKFYLGLTCTQCAHSDIHLVLCRWMNILATSQL